MIGTVIGYVTWAITIGVWVFVLIPRWMRRHRRGPKDDE